MTDRWPWGLPRFLRAWAGMMLVGLVVFLIAAPAEGQDKPGQAPQGQFVKKVYKDAEGTHNYQIFLPAGYDASGPAKKYPLVVYLHGADECGRDGIKPTQIGLGPFVRARAADYPFVVLFPQCEAVRGRRFLERWKAGSPDAKRAMRILAQVEQEYRIDRSREILTGWSMGGYGAWSLGAANPGRWAAVLPVSGGGDPAAVAALKGVPVWAVHGPGDRIVYPQQSREMVEALRKAGGRVRYDEPKGEAHSVWQRVYDSEAVDSWLASPGQAPPPRSVALVARGTALPADLLPFVPVAHISGAAYLRVGADALDVIARAIPSAVPPGILSGEFENFSVRSDDNSKKFYEATLGEISFSGVIDSATLDTLSNGRIRARLALKNITVTIGETVIDQVSLKNEKIKVNGKTLKIDGVTQRRLVEKKRRFRASTGPSEIRVGHNRPVILEFELTPYVKDRKARLKLEKASFDIAPDQYTVIGPDPAAIKTKGLFTTQGIVYQKIVEGLRSQRSRLVQEVRDVVPLLVQEMEERLDFSDSSDLFRSLWPLPIFQPRVRIWPEAFAVEDNGISIAIGMTVAAPDPSKAPARPREILLVKNMIDKVPRTQTLRVGFAPELLRPLTSMLIEEDMARVDVRDTPEPLVRQLGDRAELIKVIPGLRELPEGTEVRTELVLTKPIAIVPTGASRSASAAPMQFRFDAPGVQLVVGTRRGGDAAEWKPLAIFDLTLTHIATIRLLPPGKGVRQLEIAFAKSATITMTGRFVDGVTLKDRTIRTEQFRARYAAAWQAFAAEALQATVSVSDFQFGDAAMPLKDIGWSPPVMFIEFALPSDVKTTRRNRVAPFELTPPRLLPARPARRSPSLGRRGNRLGRFGSRPGRIRLRGTPR